MCSSPSTRVMSTDLADATDIAELLSGIEEPSVDSVSSTVALLCSNLDAGKVFCLAKGTSYHRLSNHYLGRVAAAKPTPACERNQAKRRKNEITVVVPRVAVPRPPSDVLKL